MSLPLIWVDSNRFRFYNDYKNFMKGTYMPRRAWSNKDERQYEHIKESEEKRGESTKRSKEIAARTINKKRRGEGRTKTNK